VWSLGEPTLGKPRPKKLAYSPGVVTKLEPLPLENKILKYPFIERTTKNRRHSASLGENKSRKGYTFRAAGLA
jgi:hypothetical protein